MGARREVLSVLRLEIQVFVVSAVALDVHAIFTEIKVLNVAIVTVACEKGELMVLEQERFHLL